MTLKGKGGSRILHTEIWSNPDAETYLTEIDYYERPRDCRLRMAELYPLLNLVIPETNAPIPRPTLGQNGKTTDREKHTVRWGDGETGTFEHGETYFQDEEDVFNYHPLQRADMRHMKYVIENHDYSSEEALYEHFRKMVPAEWGEKAPEFAIGGTGFYNTMFMWPMLTFGWEMFLATCLDERFEPIMDEFAEINRRVFRAWQRIPMNFCSCHDDICFTAGTVCSREWLHKYIFPRYEEYWGMMREKGVTVHFTTDGNPDSIVDDLYNCGMRGLMTEPYCDFKKVAKKYPDIFLTGEGDNRILTYGTKEDIRKMVERMVETGKECGGYTMSIGNHIAWNVPGESIKYYLDYSDKLAWR